jgi:CzcA family heavy metal efflux pump
MDLSHFAQRYDKVFLFVVVVLAVLGVFAYVYTPQAIFPNMSFARIDVVADAGQLPPEQVRVAVTQPLERAFQSALNAQQVLATSAHGSSELLVTFDPKSDPRFDLEEINQAIAQTRGALPPDVNPVALIVNSNSEPILSYALVSTTLSNSLLLELAQRNILPKLFGIPGLARTTLSGGRLREYHVLLDPAALAAYGVSAAQVQSAIAASNDIRAVGIANRYYQQYALVIDAGLHDAASIGAVSIPLRNGSSIPVSALGTVKLGVAPPSAAASYLGRPAIVLSIFALPGADVVRVAKEAERRISLIAPTLPVGTTINKYWDQTKLITDSQAALRNAILLGALLAVLVIFAFLRNFRITLVAAAIIPLAIAITLFVINRAGQTLNLMSVGGLAVAVGLIIDDAIVVIENIARNMRAHPGIPLPAVIRLSMSQIAAPMAASTGTTVVVFLPLALLSGIPGFFFRALALTLAAALIVSLSLALLISPLLVGRFMASSGPLHDEHTFVARLLDRYEPVLRWALAHRRTVFGMAAGVLALTVLLLSRVSSDFLPKLDEGQFEMSYIMPVGTSLAASDAAGSGMERLIARQPGVVTEARLTGIDSNGYSPTPQNRGLIRVSLAPEGKRLGYDALTDQLRDKVTAAFPAAQLDFHQILEDVIDDLSGAPRPIEITLAGQSQAVLNALATTLTEKISDIPGVVDPASGVVYDNPTLRIAPEGTRLAALGLSVSDVEDTMSANSLGSVATNLPGYPNLIPVRVMVAQAGTSLSQVSSSQVISSAGPTSVSTIARLQRMPLSSDINELNGQRIVRVSAGISGASLSSVIGRIKQVLRKTPLPPGYSAQIGGQYQAQQSSFAEFTAVIGVAVLLVFTVMLAAFNSFRQPLVILTAIPLALIGVALGLVVTKTTLNVSSFMGLLLLVGLVVKNGILLVDVANKRRLAGDDMTQALVAAGRTRLRPIVMTTLAAIAGLIPLAIGLGSGAEMERPLAIAVIGGLSTATLFTLILIPVLYAGFVSEESRAQQEVA